MLHFKSPGRCIRTESPAAGWGGLIRYLEVADDRYVIRQVEVFDNGNVLRYDRDHWCDAFGQLLGLRFSNKPKWAKFFPGSQVIEASEFEQVWRSAQRTSLWPQQVELSRASEWGRFRRG